MILSPPAEVVYFPFNCSDDFWLNSSSIYPTIAFDKNSYDKLKETRLGFRNLAYSQRNKRTLRLYRKRNGM